MPVHIENLTSEVTVHEGELPLSEQQLNALTEIILRRLEKKQRDAQQTREATMLRRSAAPPSGIEG